jgi:hypothetical protein
MIAYFVELHDAGRAMAQMPRSAQRFRDACDSDRPPRCVCCGRSFAVRSPKLWAVMRPVGGIEPPFTGAYGVCCRYADDERAIVCAVAQAEGMDSVEFVGGTA